MKMKMKLKNNDNDFSVWVFYFFLLLRKIYRLFESLRLRVFLLRTIEINSLMLLEWDCRGRRFCFFFVFPNPNRWNHSIFIFIQLTFVFTFTFILFPPTLSLKRTHKKFIHSNWMNDNALVCLFFSFIQVFYASIS